MFWQGTGQAGNEFKPEVAPIAGEVVIPKRTNSAFVGTDLEEQLRRAGHTRLVVAGVITNNSVEATVRMAGNLGFDVLLVEDQDRHVNSELTRWWSSADNSSATASRTAPS